MFCGRVANENINRVQRRALRAIYNDFQSDYTTLLSKGGHVTIQENNIQSLLTKVYKCLNNEVPSFLRGTFCLQIKNYNLRISNTLSRPKASTSVALHYFVYRGSSCWNNLPDSYKECDSSSRFKQELTKFNVTEICNCKICMK